MYRVNHGIRSATAIPNLQDFYNIQYRHWRRSPYRAHALSVLRRGLSFAEAEDDVDNGICLGLGFFLPAPVRAPKTHAAIGLLS